MNTYLQRSVLIVACTGALIIGGTGNVGRANAESVTAKENLEKLIKTNSCKGCDLSGLTLNRVNVAGADLEGADFSLAKFYLCNLAGANLRNSNLKGATFGGTDLGEADLRGADLRGTSLDGAYLGGTLLDGEFVTAKPYENIGVTDLEKQIYIDDPGKPKKIPETKDVKVEARGDFEEPPPQVAVNREAIKASSEKKEKAGVKKVAVPTDELQPDAPVVKKVAPVQQAIVEPNERAEDSVAQPVVAEEPVVAKGEKSGEKDEAKSKPILPKTPSKVMADDGKSSSKPPTLRATGKKRASPESETHASVVPTTNAFQENSVADSGIGGASKNLALEKSKRDNLTRLLDKNKCFGCDLSGLDLSGKNLKNVDLEKADLTGCNLERVTLDKANLKGTILQNSNMRGASLKDADLYKADLSGADLTGADVNGAKLDNAVITSAIGLESPVSLEK